MCLPRLIQILWHENRVWKVKVDAMGMSRVPGVFAGGYMSLGQSLVVRAIADGRKAGQGIRSYLEGKGP